MIDRNKLLESLIEACEKDSFKELPSWVINVINKQSEVDNTANFKHFKLHSDSTLKSNFTKDELIKYIHTVYHNWKVTDWSCEIIRRNAENISNEYDKLKKDLEITCNLHDDLLKKYESLKENPPLKFEELKEGMWVWDNVKKKYNQIFRVRKWYPSSYLIMYGDGNRCFDFEENRFYRREVNEND